MEFKDKLKAARKERNLSQQALADAIYVSRSAVAKWENGLGLPSPESMEALEGYFGVEPGFFCTDQPETVILRKNRRIRADALLPGLLALVFLIFIFPYTKTGMKLTVLLWEKPLTAYAQEKLLEPYSEPDRFLGFRAVTYPKAEAVFFHFDTGGYVGFFTPKAANRWASRERKQNFSATGGTTGSGTRKQETTGCSASASLETGIGMT